MNIYDNPNINLSVEALQDELDRSPGDNVLRDLLTIIAELRSEISLLQGRVDMHSERVAELYSRTIPLMRLGN